MTKMKNYFFDLDGTLTDPGEGITNSVIYALKTYGIEEKDREKLYSFIGPPLADSLMTHYGFSEEKAQEAIGRYREYFTDKGIFENRVYDGIPQLLSLLKERGHRVILATSKPEAFALRILEHFDLLRYFDLVCGATMDERIRSEKVQVLRYALEKSGADPKESYMIGDRRFDVEAGRRLGLFAIGVLYGYGSRKELCEAGADVICQTVAELKKELVE